MAAAVSFARVVARGACVRLLRMRELVLFFVGFDVDGSRSWLLAQRRAVCVAAISRGPRGESRGRATGRPADFALGREGSALDSSSLPDADRAGARCDGGLSRKDCGGGAVEPGLWRDGSDAAVGVGTLSGDRRAVQRDSYGDDEYRRPGRRLFVTWAFRNNW